MAEIVEHEARWRSPLTCRHTKTIVARPMATYLSNTCPGFLEFLVRHNAFVGSRFFLYVVISRKPNNCTNLCTILLGRVLHNCPLMCKD